MKVTKIFTATLLFLLYSVLTFAQPDNPCGGSSDPDDAQPCPLDSWVFALAAFTVAVALWTMYRQRHEAKFQQL